MTLPSNTLLQKNVLITAWNDSGAGRLMRLMDGLDQVFAFPFELLLGSESSIGVAIEPELVSCKYRWNIFRDSQLISQSIDSLVIDASDLLPSESEFYDWLSGKKFNVLPCYIKKARSVVDSLSHRSASERMLLDSRSVLTYIESIKSIFSEVSTSVNLIHTPCAALDWESPSFWKIFNLVIIVVIDPLWGFGNMHSRNNISFSKYLERWLRINQESIRLKKHFNDKVLIIHTSIDTHKQADNLSIALDFIGLKKPYLVDKKSTILGNSIENVGFPHGGILEWNLSAYQRSVSQSLEILANSDAYTRMRYNQCILLCEQMKQ